MKCECGCGLETKIGKRSGVPNRFINYHNRKGKTMPEKAKKKISEAGIGKHLSPETRDKISNAHKGKIVSKETRKNMSDAQKGKTHTEETKKKMSISQKERAALEDRTGENSNWWGRNHTDETKNKIGISRKGKYAGKNAPGWQGGVSFVPYCPKFNTQLKERIRGRDNRTCQLCGIKENGQRLSVHHIHYDKENCYPDLISLCAGCHSKVHVNRDYYEELFMDKLRQRSLIIE